MTGCCLTLAGIVKDCNAGMGGIDKAYIACHTDVSGVTVTEGMITAITATPESFKEYEFRKQTGSVTTTINSDTSVGSVYFESAIVLQFAKQETAKRLEIAALAQADLVVIIKDNNGKYWYFGKDFGVTLSEGTGETGTAFGDFNGYNITLTDMSREYPFEVSEDAMNDIV